MTWICYLSRHVSWESRTPHYEIFDCQLPWYRLPCGCRLCPILWGTVRGCALSGWCLPFQDSSWGLSFRVPVLCEVFWTESGVCLSCFSSSFSSPSCVLQVRGKLTSSCTFFLVWARFSLPPLSRTQLFLPLSLSCSLFYPYPSCF